MPDAVVAMLVDLHAHYAMHLVPDSGRGTHDQVLKFSRRRWQALIVDLISRLANYQGPGDTPSVTEELMREGDVGVVLSPLYAPFDEMDLSKSYGAPPAAGYAADILAQIQTIEDHVASRGQDIAVAHSPAELDEIRGRGSIALIHAIEGGFQLGADEGSIRQNVRALAGRGVAYVTVAHLFWRQVATNAPALPFLPDWLYHLAFPQPQQGLGERGQAAVEAMLEEGILVDITHMSERSIADTLAVLDRRDPDRRVPVLATHMACRFGSLEYSFTDETIRRVAERGGLLGCILCEHYITSRLKRVKSYEDSVAALYRHIDRIAEVTGSFDAIGIGSDLDGYIKPALPGLEHMGRMRALQDSLRARYGAADAEKISGGNALRALRAGWRGHTGE